jgi:DNA invertase Pin-like site-specific DNA recombinase
VKAFGYLRISKLDQDSTSPQRQRQAIERWCRDRGATLVETFEDLDLSAYKRGVRRPGLERMLGRLGEADTIVTWRLDRLARSVVGFAKMLERFEAAGVSLATTDGQVDMTTAAGRAMVQITAVFAELEAGTTSERTRAMHQFKRGRNEFVGRVPFGWKLNGKHLEIEPREFAVLEAAARRYVAGESQRRISADTGIPHPTLNKRLRSERFMEALSPEVAGPLARELAERGRTGTRAKRSLLGGIARCGVCGDGMTVVAKAKGWAAYGCNQRNHVSISKAFLDNHVTDAVIAAIDTGKLIERLERRRRAPRGIRPVSELEARLEILERDFYEEGRLTRDSFLRRREGLLRKLESARKAETGDGVDIPKELAEHLAEGWGDFMVHEQRRIIAAVLERVEVAKAVNHARIDPSRVTLVWR